jgi:hypothetical protein
MSRFHWYGEEREAYERGEREPSWRENPYDRYGRYEEEQKHRAFEEAREDERREERQREEREQEEREQEARYRAARDRAEEDRYIEEQYYAEQQEPPCDPGQPEPERGER